MISKELFGNQAIITELSLDKLIMIIELVNKNYSYDVKVAVYQIKTAV